MTKQEYAQWSRQESPRSNGPLNILKAFVSGGVVCLLGQLLIFFFQNRGAGENAPVFASLCLIVLSALLTALANSMVSAAMEFKTEGYILGLGAKMFSIAGPVIVYGISASVLYGLILMMIG